MHDVVNRPGLGRSPRPGCPLGPAHADRGQGNRQAWPREAAPAPEGAGGEPRLGGEGAQPPGAGSGAEPRLAVLPAPGASNTRRNTPPAARGRQAKPNDSHRFPPKAPPPPDAVAVLCTRVDAFYLAYRGEVKESIRALLRLRLQDAKALGTAVTVPIGDTQFVLDPRSRDGWWKLAAHDARVVVDDSHHVDGWQLEVCADAKLLAESGPHSALALARAVADTMLELVTGERLRRADLCADAIGLDLETIDPRAWLTPRRARVKTFGNLQVPFVEHHKTEKRTGFQIGQGALVARVYDKRVELALRPEEKRSIEEARWKGAGWNGQADVVRIEFQMRGEALDEIDDGRLRDPEVLLARLNPIWAYCTRSWLKLVERGKSNRLHRCPVDEGWKVIQGARFGEDTGEIAERERRRGVGRARLALGTTFSFLAGNLTLVPLPIARGREHVAEWSDERSEVFVHEQIASQFARAPRLIADDLIRTLGPREAAAFVIEKRNAVCARARRADEQKRERGGSADNDA